MYYSARVLAAVIADMPTNTEADAEADVEAGTQAGGETARRALPAIAADRKRVTSIVAAMDAVLALSAPGDDAPARTPAEAQALLQSFLEEHGIELRELPPTSKALALATDTLAAVQGAPPDTLSLLDAVCAAYYEVPAFDLDALPDGSGDEEPGDEEPGDEGPGAEEHGTEGDAGHPAGA